MPQRNGQACTLQFHVAKRVFTTQFTGKSNVIQLVLPLHGTPVQDTGAFSKGQDSELSRLRAHYLSTCGCYNEINMIISSALFFHKLVTCCFFHIVNINNCDITQNQLLKLLTALKKTGMDHFRVYNKFWDKPSKPIHFKV